MSKSIQTAKDNLRMMKDETFQCTSESIQVSSG